MRHPPSVHPMHRAERERARATPSGRVAVARMAAGAALLAALACGGEGGAPTRVVIPPGSSFRAAADSLERTGVVRSSRLFRAYAKLRGRDRALKPGTYELAAGADWDVTLDAVTQGRSLSATLTIPEGFDLRAIVPLVSARLDVPADLLARGALLLGRGRDALNHRRD